MQSFRSGRLRDYRVPASTVWLLNDIAEFKGRQEFLTQQTPRFLKTLRDLAIVRSAESSNRIEGVVVGPNRLEPLVLGNSRPQDRSEQEVQGYRRALSEIHSGHAGLVCTPDTIRSLHALCQPASGDAGQFKRFDNDIVQLTPGKVPTIRFRCVTAKKAPGAIAELCERYRQAFEDQAVRPLIAVAALVHDFLCIHPFRDGNGRVSRLLTLLALYHHGYDVGGYVSLERLIEESREDYYKCLHQSTGRWHQNRHRLTPWFSFILAIIRRAYAELEDLAWNAKAPRGTKAEFVLAAISAYQGEFRLMDLQRDCPGVGRDWIRTILANLKKSGDVACRGRGPAARWRRLRNRDSNA
ncbi:MAG: Fic family protein [Bryobacterales bacterium]|nr:Fic family protein [Bryobacterales bacterium]